jgi:hypothetical protein
MCRVNAGAVAFFDFEECERWLEEVWATQRIYILPNVRKSNRTQKLSPSQSNNCTNQETFFCKLVAYSSFNLYKYMLYKAEMKIH